MTWLRAPGNAVLLALFVWIVAREYRPTCSLTIELIEADTKQPLPGMVRITAAGQPLSPTALLSRGQGLDDRAAISSWFVLPRRSRVDVPSEQVVIEAFHGLSTELARKEVDLRGKKEATVRLALRRFYEPRSRGLSSGNTHLHLMQLSRAEADRYLREIPGADGLDLVFLSYLERAGDDLTYISNHYTKSDLASLSQFGVLFENGEEHRHNFGSHGEGYGHVMFLAIDEWIQPVSIGPGIMKRGSDGIPLRRGMAKARADGAAVIWCHNDFGVEDAPSWLARRLDAQNIFDGGHHGSFEDTFYRYLDVGLRVPFSTGTDWFIYDFSRAFVEAERPLTAKGWLEGLRRGRSFITNGPFLEFRVNGRGIGETLRLAAPGKIEVRARGTGRIAFRRIELIHDGVVTTTAAAQARDGHFEARLDTAVEVDGSGWLALRIPPPGSGDGDAATPRNEYGRPLFAHTSPIYVEVAGEEVFDRATAGELLEDVEKAIDTVKQKATFATDEERREVLGVYEEAADALRRRLGSED